MREAQEAVEGQQRLARAFATLEQTVLEVREHRNELLRVLKKARPAVHELHGQGIGCPDCRRDNPDGSPSCALIEEVEALIAQVKAWSR